MLRNCVSYVITLAPSVPKVIAERLEQLGIPCERLPAVDLRESSPDLLRQHGIISPLAHLTLSQGRCNDHMLSSTGAIGCYLSHIIAAQRIAALPTADSYGLVLEEDCLLDVDLLKPALTALLLSSSQQEDDFFDVIAIGTKRMRECTPNPTLPCAPENFEEKRTYGNLELTKIEGTIMEGTHCLLYTRDGARKTVKLLGNTPIEMQIDSALSCLTTNSSEEFKLWRSRKGASQQFLTGTTVQDSCILCLFKGSGHTLYGLLILIILLVGILLIAVNSRCRRSCAALRVDRN